MYSLFLPTTSFDLSKLPPPSPVLGRASSLLLFPTSPITRCTTQAWDWGEASEALPSGTKYQGHQEKSVTKINNI